MKLITSFISLIHLFQDSPDFMRSTGKIYIVTAIVLTIFIGIIVFLFFLERRIRSLENEIKNEEPKSR